MVVFSFPVPQDVVDPDENIKYQLVISSAVGCVVFTIAVGLRFVSRRLVKAPLSWDDWLVLAALPFAWLTAITDFYAALHDNVGRHIQYTAPQDLPRFLIGVYVYEMFYTLAIGFCKLSILALYWRIFPARSIKIPLCVTIGITLAWMISSIFAVAFSCSPVSGTWDLTIHATCVDSLALDIGRTVGNISLDLILMGLPLGGIRTLKISRVQKITVLATLLVGFLSTIASALRFNQVIRVKLSPDFDPTFSIVPIAMWGVIEVTSAIVCVCLPMMRPILRFIVRGSAVPKPLQFSNPVSLSSPSMQSHHLLGSPQKALILRSPDPQETFDSGLSNKVSHCSDSPTTRQVETFVDNSWSEGRATSWAEFFEGGSWGNDISLSLSNKAMQQQKEGERTWMTFSDTDRGLSGRLSSDHNSRRGTGQYQV